MSNDDSIDIIGLARIAWCPAHGNTINWIEEDIGICPKGQHNVYWYTPDEVYPKDPNPWHGNTADLPTGVEENASTIET